MALTDSLSGFIKSTIDLSLIRSQSDGEISGKDRLIREASQTISDGSGADQASGYFSSTFTATTGGITISLADSADPLGAAGDDVPTSDPEGLKLRAIFLENLDATNYVTLGLGSNAITSWLGGTSPTVRIPAGGMFLQTFPAGLDAMNDASDDEITVTANTASCSVKITYIYG